MATDVVEEVEPVDEFLAHYGVKGMRWGKRQSQASLDRQAGRKAQKEARASIRDTKSSRKAEKKAARKQADQDILDARARQEKRAGNLSKKAALTYAQTTKKGQEAADAAYMRAERVYLGGKDAQMAAKATRGEKVAGGLLVGAFATALVAPIAIAMLEESRY